MTDQTFSLLLALGSTLCFSSSSLVFSEYSKRISVAWMNCFKAVVALFALIISVPLVSGVHPIESKSAVGFMVSGLLGLNIGDLFLFYAFTRLGAARTLILFGFQPLFMGIAAFYLFGQPLDTSRALAVVFLILCLFTFSLEKYRQHRRWEIVGLLAALVGVSLDTIGILISRASFEASPLVTPIEGNLYRVIGALAGFAVLAKYRPIHLLAGFKACSIKTRGLLILASFAGTYFSLLLYLTAIRVGHLASIAAVAITGPMFATLLESVFHRKAPSPYLLVAFTFFCVGFYILLRTA